MKTILITRAPGQQLTSLLLGRVSLDFIPLIETVPSETSWQDRKLLEAIPLRRFSWVVFTSENGARWASVLLQSLSLEIPADTNIVSQGPTTAAAVKHHFGRHSFLPPHFLGEHVAEFLCSNMAPDDEALLLVAGKTRGVIRETLESKQLKISQVSVYNTQSRILTSDELSQLSFHVENSVIVCFSPSAVETLQKYFPGRLPSVRFISIGPVTSEAIRKVGGTLISEALEQTEVGVAKVIHDTFSEEC